MLNTHEEVPLAIEPFLVHPKEPLAEEGRIFRVTSPKARLTSLQHQAEQVTYIIPYHREILPDLMAQQAAQKEVDDTKQQEQGIKKESFLTGNFIAQCIRSTEGMFPIRPDLNARRLPIILSKCDPAQLMPLMGALADHGPLLLQMYTGKKQLEIQSKLQEADLARITYQEDPEKSAIISGYIDFLKEQNRDLDTTSLKQILSVYRDYREEQPRFSKYLGVNMHFYWGQEDPYFIQELLRKIPETVDTFQRPITYLLGISPKTTLSYSLEGLVDKAIEDKQLTIPAVRKDVASGKADNYGTNARLVAISQLLRASFFGPLNEQEFNYLQKTLAFLNEESPQNKREWGNYENKLLKIPTMDELKTFQSSGLSQYIEARMELRALVALNNSRDLNGWETITKDRLLPEYLLESMQVEYDQALNDYQRMVFEHHMSHITEFIQNDVVLYILTRGMKNTLGILRGEEEKNVFLGLAATWMTFAGEEITVAHERRTKFDSPRIELYVTDSLLGRLEENPYLQDFFVSIQLHEVGHEYIERLQKEAALEVLSNLGCRDWSDASINALSIAAVDQMRKAFFRLMDKDPDLKQLAKQFDHTPFEAFSDVFMVAFMHRNSHLIRDQDFRAAIEEAHIAIAGHPLYQTLERQLKEIGQWGNEYIALENAIYPESPRLVSQSEKLQQQVDRLEIRLANLTNMLNAERARAQHLEARLNQVLSEKEALTQSQKKLQEEAARYKWWIRELLEIGKGPFFDLKKQLRKRYDSAQIDELITSINEV